MTRAPVSFPEFLWVWNRDQGQETPRHHLRMARWLAERLERGGRRGVMLAFRNSGKSTVVGLFCAWALLRRTETRILVLSAEHALARTMARNVKRVIERHPLTRRLVPRRREQWAADRFTVPRAAELRDPSMLAKGLGANITGARADIIICDDVEVPNTCDTPLKRADLRARLEELEFILVPGGLQLFVGTPHAHDTLYATESPDAFLAGGDRLEIPVLDAEGNSAWPERFPPARIKELRRRAGPVRFAAQMLLRPADPAQGRLDASRLRRYDAEPLYAEANGTASLTLMGRRLVSASCWWDPSFGAPGQGDASIIACVYSDNEGGYWLHRVSGLTHDPSGSEDAATQMCRAVAGFLKTYRLPAVHLETNGIGKFLPGLLRKELNLSGVRASVVEVVSRRPKAVRILEAFDAVLAAGALAAHACVWDGPFIEEMHAWRPEAPGRDDALDAVAGCLAAEPVRLPRIPPPPPGADWRLGAAPVHAATRFDL